MKCCVFNSAEYNLDSLFDFLKYKGLLCVLIRIASIESPQWGDSNEYIQHTIFNIERKSPKIMSIDMGLFLLGTQ